MVGVIVLSSSLPLLLLSSPAANAFGGVVDDVAATVGRINADIDRAVSVPSSSTTTVPSSPIFDHPFCCGREEVRHALATRRHCVVRLSSPLEDVPPSFFEKDVDQVGQAAAVSADRQSEFVGVFRSPRSTFVDLRFDSHGEFLPQSARPLLPELRQVAKTLSGVSVDLLDCLECRDAALDLVDLFPSRNEDDTASATVQRLCHYAAASGEREVFGTHSDTTFFTLVPLSTEPGLQVFDGSSWLCPEAEADAQLGRDVLVMVGELLDLVSNGLYPAAPHRVILANKRDRISTPLLLRARRAAFFPPVATSASSTRIHHSRDETSLSSASQQDERLSMASVWAAMQARTPEEARQRLEVPAARSTP